MSKARTPDEVKKDIRDRIGRRAPFLHADQTEAEEALAKMSQLLKGKPGPQLGMAWAHVGKEGQTSPKKPATELRQKRHF